MGYVGPTCLLAVALFTDYCHLCTCGLPLLSVCVVYSLFVNQLKNR